MASRGGRTIMEVSYSRQQFLRDETNLLRYGTSLHRQTRIMTHHVLAVLQVCPTISTSSIPALNPLFYLAQHHWFRKTTVLVTSQWPTLAKSELSVSHSITIDIRQHKFNASLRSSCCREREGTLLPTIPALVSATPRRVDVPPILLPYFYTPLYRRVADTTISKAAYVVHHATDEYDIPCISGVCFLLLPLRITFAYQSIYPRRLGQASCKDSGLGNMWRHLVVIAI